MSQAIPIFYYHSVGGAPPQTLALTVFRRHLESLRAHNFTLITVADLVQGRRPHDGRPCAVLAFDDGLLDNYENVFPLLLEFGFRATFYVVPGYDGVTRWVNPRNGRWSDVARQSYTISFASMQKNQRRELVAHGMEIGCHSFTHRRLTRVPVRELAHETRGARVFLEDELGAAVQTFCYPNGAFGRREMDAVRSAGFVAACGTMPGYYRAHGNPYALRRFLVENPLFFEEVLGGRAFHPAAWPLSWVRWRNAQVACR